MDACDLDEACQCLKEKQDVIIGEESDYLKPSGWKYNFGKIATNNEVNENEKSQSQKGAIMKKENNESVHEILSSDSDNELNQNDCKNKDSAEEITDTEADTVIRPKSSLKSLLKMDDEDDEDN